MPGTNPAESYEPGNIYEPPHTLTLPSGWSDGFSLLLRKMLVYEQDARCTIEEVLADSWVKRHRAPHVLDDPLESDLHWLATHQPESQEDLRASAQDVIILGDPFSSNYLKGKFLGGGEKHNSNYSDPTN